MKKEEIVYAFINAALFCLIDIVFIVYGITSCSRREAESSYITTITVTSQRDYDTKTMANIEISSEYSFIDYQIDYENDRVIINLKKENGSLEAEEEKE